MTERKTRYPGIYERVNGDGSKVYRARLRVKGSPAETQTFDRLTDAREWLATRTSDARQKKGLGSARATLGDVVAKYEHEELGRLVAEEQDNRRRHLGWWKTEAEDGTMLLRDVTRGWVQGKLTQLRKKGLSGRPVAFSTSNRYKAALSAVLSAAVEWEWISANPVHNSSRRKKAKGDREVARDREEVKDEMKAVRESCAKSRDLRLLPLLICARASGARQGELMRLRWEDVELGHEVPRAITVDAKNGDDRMLYFPGEAGGVLRDLQAGRFLSPYVFADPENPKTEPPFPVASWRSALRRSKVVDFHWHDLRHFWACEMLDHGKATLPELMMLGGWRSTLAMRIYIGRAQRQGSAAVDAIHKRHS